MSDHSTVERLRDSGRLPEAERQELLRHVRACSACRAAFAAEDPTRLFALLAAEPVPAASLERLSQSVRAATDTLSAPRPRLSWRVAASLAASLFLAGFLGSVLREPAPTPGAPVAAAVPVPIARDLRPAGGVELYLPDEADVVNFTVGETQVVMIFNEALEL